MQERNISLRSKEQILKDTSLLNAFLDSMVENSFDLWRKMVNAEMKKEGKTLLATLDEDAVKSTLNESFNAASAAGIFTNQIDEESVGEFFVITAILGYLIENNEEAEVFTNDIAERWRLLSILNENEEGNIFVKDALKKGIEWRKNAGKNLPRYEEIKGLISGLDVSSLET